MVAVILIVDDEPHIRQILAKAIGRAGHEAVSNALKAALAWCSIAANEPKPATGDPLHDWLASLDSSMS